MLTTSMSLVAGVTQGVGDGVPVAVRRSSAGLERNDGRLGRDACDPDAVDRRGDDRCDVGAVTAESCTRALLEQSPFPASTGS